MPSPHYIDTVAPGRGEAVAIAPDILWVRIGLPFPPGHVNCWLIRSDAGWTLVDTGPDTAEARQAWQQVLASVLDGLSVERVVCTHHHIDHVGLAAWICEAWQAPLLMTRTEWLTGRLLPLQWAGERPDRLAEWDRITGLPQAVAEAFWQVRVERCCRQALPIPDSFVKMGPGRTIPARGGAFEVLVATGHSPAPLLLFEPARRILISGDQVLPRITPHVGVDYMEPDADPLGAYLAWLSEIGRLPADTLVLPSHGHPFHGLQARLAEVAGHHRGALDALLAACAEPSDIQSLMPTLFKAPLRSDQLALATQECVAHIRHLEACGLVERMSSGPHLRFRATDRRHARAMSGTGLS